VITPQARSEAASGAMVSVIATTWLRSTTTRSAKAPVFIAFQTSPDRPRIGGGASSGVAQATGWPVAQGAQWPQARIRVTTTRVPRARPRASGPSAVTRPAASWP
jgi:hypothetical protein